MQICDEIRRWLFWICQNQYERLPSLSQESSYANVFLSHLLDLDVWIRVEGVGLLNVDLLGLFQHPSLKQGPIVQPVNEEYKKTWLNVLGLSVIINC